MILGNPKKINLGTSSFRKLRENDCLYIDKTRFIEKFLNEQNDAQLIIRQRRLGKSLNLDTLRLFLSDSEDTQKLFKGTYIETSGVWGKRNTEPVFLFDFKHLIPGAYKEQIKEQIINHIKNYFSASGLCDCLEKQYGEYLQMSENNPGGLLYLTKIVYETTGKKSYILIDEYDSLLTKNYKSGDYEEIKEYETAFLSAGLKGNNYLAKALLTGVMRVARESILSGLNNLHTYDLFSDKTYTDDFGFTEEEIDALLPYYDFDKDTLRSWYNGVKIKGKAVYNTYSVASFLQAGEYGNYWGQSGTIDIIIDLLNESRRAAVIRLLNGETVKSAVLRRISLRELVLVCDDNIFYSFLLQTGYLALEELDSDDIGVMKIPNIELMRVWKEFILSSVVKGSDIIRTLFDNINDPDIFARDIEEFLTDRLSYFDLDSDPKVNEKLYHIFVLGILSAYKDSRYTKPPLSNRESGDGRYDILIERTDFSVIFEFKHVKNRMRLAQAADAGLRQIDEKRYCADVPKDKPIIKTAVAFYKKQCRVRAIR